jgi:hypothetical protein
VYVVPRSAHGSLWLVPVVNLACSHFPHTVLDGWTRISLGNAQRMSQEEINEETMMDGMGAEGDVGEQIWER